MEIEVVPGTRCRDTR